MDTVFLRLYNEKTGSFFLTKQSTFRVKVFVSKFYTLRARGSNLLYLFPEFVRYYISNSGVNQKQI
jgi:hypothetical protein